MGPSLLATGPAQAAGAFAMTPADLADLTARVTILERIVRAIEAFDDCYYETDVHDCERELRAALKAAQLPA